MVLEELWSALYRRKCNSATQSMGSAIHLLSVICYPGLVADHC